MSTGTHTPTDSEYEAAAARDLLAAVASALTSPARAAHVRAVIVSALADDAGAVPAWAAIMREVRS